MSNAAFLSSFNEPSGELHALGIRHHNAPVAIREKLTFSPEAIPGALLSLREFSAVDEAVLLSTCNRTEWYLYSEQTPALDDWLIDYTNLGCEELRRHFFVFRGRDAVRHLYRVACGLDSLILGETQILGQLKAAYRIGKSCRSTGTVLERLLQQSFSVAKQIRHTTGIGANPISVAHAGVRLTDQFFDDYHKRTAIVIGAGETGQLVSRYLREVDICRLIIANRTLANAQRIAEQTGGYAICLGQLQEHLHEADIIIGTARADAWLISRGEAAAALAKRHHAFQVYIDLALPRDFDPEIDGLGNAFLFGIDDLKQIVAHNRKTRKNAAEKAEVMIDLYSDEFLDWLHSRPQQQLIGDMYKRAGKLRQALLQEAYRKLAHGEDPVKIMEEFSYKLTNKLLHHPSTMIHAIPPDHKDWLAIIADTFETTRGQ